MIRPIEERVKKMIYTYRVTFETDSTTGKIVVSLPSLNYTADFGATVEEALKNLKELAQVQP